jgi:hypothetical protein
MSNRLLIVIIGLLVANLFVSIRPPSPSTPTDQSADDGAVSLLRPWFLNSAFASDDRSARAVTNIADEAGISAYVKTASAINLTLASTAFTSPVESNTNYILGTITPTGYDADFGAQVMVHKSGWIMAWYHKDRVTSTIVHVNDSTLANKTKLSLVIDAVTTKLRIAALTPTYYHFKYPTANRMVIARKIENSGRYMYISLPLAVTVSESSSYVTNGSCSWSGYYTKLEINDVQLFSRCDVEDTVLYDDITAKLDAATNKLYFNRYQLAVVIVYQA